VVGASRGLGLALAEEYCGGDWRVIATARGPSKELEALASRYPGSLEIETVEIVDADSVCALRAAHWPTARPPLCQRRHLPSERGDAFDGRASATLTVTATRAPGERKQRR
jgi:NAD(P)-dependent dehydrogenase (short-subunit alcohol dehydrogenase family)